jgi:IS30 family transposase
MEQGERSRKGKHLTREERIVIERLSRGGIPPRDIAGVLGRHQRTIERELARGRVKHLDYELRTKYVYSSDRGQDLYDLNASAKGPGLKLGCNYELAEFVRCRIVEHKEAPDVVAHRMRRAGMEGFVCTKTLYSYIEQDVIPGVSNESLWEKRKRRKQRTRIFYAHPYSSWERGSNENANRIIRRFVAKGRDIARFTRQKILEIETWINNYPRRILDFMTPNELFMNELKAIS